MQITPCQSVGISIITYPKTLGSEGSTQLGICLFGGGKKIIEAHLRNVAVKDPCEEHHSLRVKNNLLSNDTGVQICCSNYPCGSRDKQENTQPNKVCWGSQESSPTSVCWGLKLQ